MSDFMKMSQDHLKALSPAEVAAWYERLADFVEQKNSKVNDALAPQFLRHYIKGQGKKFVFSAPDHLKNSKYVVGVLKNHRAWYLTEKGCGAVLVLKFHRYGAAVQPVPSRSGQQKRFA